MNKQPDICEYCDPNAVWRKSFICRAGVRVYIDYSETRNRYYLGLKLRKGEGVKVLIAKGCPVCGRRLPNGKHSGSEETNLGEEA